MEPVENEYTYKIGIKGRISITINYSQRYAIIHDLKVCRLFRKRGYGNFLMKIAIYHCRVSRVNQIYLGVKNNSWVRDWYIRYGFNYDGVDDRPGYIRMIKYLNYEIQ